MQKNIFIAGDWGTSNLRLYLCEWSAAAGEKTLDVRYGNGITKLDHSFSDTFFSLTNSWFSEHGNMPVILSGMVGSNIGWREAPYLECPISINDIVNGRLSFIERDIEFSILSGLKTLNPLGLPDIMRGEELQILGWNQLNSSVSVSRQLFLLPGTHNKWVEVAGGQVQNFLTAFTGELYSLLINHSVLIAEPVHADLDQKSFMRGVNTIKNLRGAHIPHALFSTRSLQVLEGMSNAQAHSYLSGLIAAADVLGAMAIFNQDDNATFNTTIIGETILAEQYRLVLEQLGLSCEVCEPSEIATAAYQLIYRKLYHSDLA